MGTPTTIDLLSSMALFRSLEFSFEYRGDYYLSAIPRGRMPSVLASGSTFEIATNGGQDVGVIRVHRVSDTQIRMYATSSRTRTYVALVSIRGISA